MSVVIYYCERKHPSLNTINTNPDIYYIACAVMCTTTLSSSKTVYFQSEGGTYLEKGYRDVQQERPLFHAPSRPPLQYFPVPQHPFLPKNHIISQFSIQNA